jgi:hypothetical protein
MKKSIPLTVILIFLALSFVKISNAQFSSSIASFASDAWKTDFVDKDDIGKVAIASKIKSSFSKRFKTTANVSWFVTGDITHAIFTENGKRHRVNYKGNGKWYRTIINYKEDQLPNSIKSLVKSEFKRYNIDHVFEVHERGFKSYVINITKGKSFKQIVVHDGAIAVNIELVLQ